MTEGIEYSKLLKKFEKIEPSKIIPKLFLQNYGVFTNSSGLFRSGITGRENEFKERSSKLRLSEGFFYYLRDGLEQDKKIYDERRLKIADSEHAETLKTPLLLIFEHENFKSAAVKTPELYFATYKEIINSKIIDNKNFNLDTVISIVKSGRSGTYKSRQKKIQDILSSENLEPYDLVCIYFYLQSTNFFKNMYVFVENHNPIFNWLFQSDMTSQLLDYIFELKNQESFALVDRIIISKVKSSIHYIYNWEFENGVELIAWFKAFMYYIKGQLLEAYLEKKAFLKFPLLAEKFISSDISLRKISDMFSSIKDSHISMNPSDEASADLQTSIEKNRPPVAPYRKYSQRFFDSETTGGRRSPAPIGSFRRSFEPNIGSLLEKNQASSKRKSLETKRATFLQPRTSFLETEKKQKALTQEAQVFLDYSKKFFGPNINPALKSPQVLEREYIPISGICQDLITNKGISIINVSSPENKYTSQYTLPMIIGKILVCRSSVFSEGLISSKETVVPFARQTNKTQTISLYSTQKSEPGFFFDKRVLKNHPLLFNADIKDPKNLIPSKAIRLENGFMDPTLDLSSNSGLDLSLFPDENNEPYITFFKVNEETPINLTPGKEIQSQKDCATPLVNLDSERSPMSLFLENAYLEEENIFRNPNPHNTFGN